MFSSRYSAFIIFTTLAALSAGMAAAQVCPGAALAVPKDSVLYLYFPTSSDATFPEYGTPYGINTSPAAAFNVSDLDSSIGTTAQLRQRIFEMVTDDYCEFNVEVTQSTSTPSPSEARWQIVAVGSDSETVFGGALFGVAQDEDTGDSDAQDYARVYAKSFKDAYGGTGGALAGSGSTLQRWATAIAGTTSHEAGHNYGLGHGHASSLSGEDAATNHILATGSTGLTGEMRASLNRHFSDTSYQILGHNLGLNWYTLHNWDFINPNSSSAHAMTLTLLSTASSLTRTWFWNGSTSPWTDPTASSTGTTKNFQGTTYNVFELEFSTAKTWSGPTAGVVGPGAKFHTGAAFNEPVIVYEVELEDSSGNPLPLKPRMAGYDGATDLATADFHLILFNPDPDEGPLVLQDLVISYLPRMAAIETMIEGAELADPRGIAISPLRPPRIPREGIADELGVPGRRTDVVGNRVEHYEPIEVADRVSARLAGFAAMRHVDVEYDATGCQKGYVPADVAAGDIEYCPEGTALSLFPATSVYVTATVVDPDARYFDPAVGDFVEGPLESKLFFQLAGFVPDFNDNGVDDLLDIRNGTSRDDDDNGIPDEVEKGRGAWSLHAGTVRPEGVLSHLVDDGWTVNLDYVRQISRRWDWDLRLGFSRFDGRQSFDLDLWTLSGNLKYTFNPGAPVQLFVNGGGGLYYFDPGDLEGGYNLGVGLAAPVTGSLTFEATYNYHSTFTASPDLELSQAQLGLLFSF